MKENKVKKIEILDANELEDVAGGRAYNEAWECPKCGYRCFCHFVGGGV